MTNRGRTRDGQHHGTAIKEPGYGQLGHGRTMPFRDGVECSARLSKFAGSDRIPGYESEIVFFAILEHIFMFPIANIVPVLYCDDFEYFASLIDFARLHFAQPNMPDFARFLKFGDDA